MLALCGTLAAQEQPNSAGYHARHNPTSPYYVGGRPEQTPATPPEWWEDRWGAIAEDGNGVFGIVSDTKSERKARKGALQECKKRGGGECSVVATYSSQCAAIVANDIASYRGYAASEDGAIADAEMKCSKSSISGCHVFYSGCSLPVRIK